MRTVSANENISLVDRRGRKYLTAIERQRFVKAAETDPIPVIQTFTLALSPPIENVPKVPIESTPLLS